MAGTRNPSLSESRRCFGLGLTALVATTLIGSPRATSASSPWLAGGRVPSGSQVVTFSTVSPAQPLFGPPSTPAPAHVAAALVLPSGRGPFPSVAMLHSTAGVDGTATPYAVALREAGIASLIVDSWGTRGIVPGRDLVASRPRPTDALPDAVGALRFLAADPRIDRARLGVMGQSWGAEITMRLASPMVRQAFGGDAWFRAFAALYGACWWYGPNGPARVLITPDWPIGPLLFLAAGQDDYEPALGGAACRALLGPGSPAAARGVVRLHVYPEALHAWDRLTPGVVTINDRVAHGGRGGPVRMGRDDATAADSVRRVRDFFAETLEAGRR